MRDDHARQPDRLAHLLGGLSVSWPVAAREWQGLMSQARRAGLHGRFAAAALRRFPVDPTLPSTPCFEPGHVGPESLPLGLRSHLESAELVCRRASAGMLLEADRLAEVLQQAGHRLVLLKGAAYLCAGLPPSRGRVFGDIDILVPRDCLQSVERALMSGGWISAEPNACWPLKPRRLAWQLPTYIRRSH